MSEYKIADGHNNAGALAALEALSAPLFAAYADGLLSEWHDFEARQWAGDRTLVPVGRAWVAWKFFRLTRDELAYLQAHFGSTVTIRTLDKGTNSFANFNATLVLPDLSADARWEADEWLDVRIEFRDLETI